MLIVKKEEEARGAGERVVGCYRRASPVEQKGVLMEWTSTRFRTWIGSVILLAGIVMLSMRSSVQVQEPAGEPWQIQRPESYEQVGVDGAGRSLVAAGDQYRLQGKTQQALKAYQQAAEIARKTNDRTLLGDSLNGLGLIYNRLGDYYQALSLYSSALDIYRSLSDDYSAAEALHNLGACYSFLGESQAALDVLQEALDTWPANYRRGVTLTAIATVYDLEGKHEKAIEKLREAYALRHAAPEVDVAKRQRGKATTLDRLASAYKQVGRMEEARRAFEAALTLWEELENQLGLAVTSNNLAWLYIDWNSPQTALQHFARAQPLLEQVGRRHTVAHSLLGQAHAHSQLGNLAEAEAVLERALGIVESLWQTPHSPLLRTSFLARRQLFFEFFVDLLMRRHAVNPEAGYAARALATAERFKARGLLDLLHEEPAPRRTADQALLELEEDLRREMNHANGRRLELIRQEAPQEDIAEIERHRRDLILRYEALAAQLRVGHPGSTSAASPLESGEMQRLLDSDTVLLHYALGADRSFLWLVSRDQIRPYVLPGRQEIEDLARKTYDWLANSDQRRDQSSGPDAARLSEILLGPVETAIRDQRLLVVADGFLHYIPFAALPVPGNRSGAPPLILDHEIVKIPSASVLAALRRRSETRRPAPLALAVIADPVFAPDDARLSDTAGQRAAASASRDARWATPVRLKHSAREAAALLSLVPQGQRFEAVGFDANRHTVLEGELHRYRRVHFAVHGEIDEERPEYSSLVLSLLDPQGQAQAGRLYLHEVWNLRLAAELVVLSACNSALGRQVQGEGMLGMTRGFMAAGARRVVVSLWLVDDEATTHLMERFYQEILQGGRTAAAALRAAQRSMRQHPDWQAPYYWAGFVLQGDGH